MWCGYLQSWKSGNPENPGSDDIGGAQKLRPTIIQPSLSLVNLPYLCYSLTNLQKRSYSYVPCWYYRVRQYSRTLFEPR